MNMDQINRALSKEIALGPLDADRRMSQILAEMDNFNRSNVNYARESYVGPRLAERMLPGQVAANKFEEALGGAMARERAALGSAYKPLDIVLDKILTEHEAIVEKSRNQMVSRTRGPLAEAYSSLDKMLFEMNRDAEEAARSWSVQSRDLERQRREEALQIRAARELHEGNLLRRVASVDRYIDEMYAASLSNFRRIVEPIGGGIAASFRAQMLKSAIGPVNAFDRFAQRTLEDIAATNDCRSVKRMEVGLDIAGRQLKDRLWGPSILSVQPRVETYIPRNDYNLFEVQQGELGRYPSDLFDGSVRSISETTLSGRISGLAKQCVDSIIKLNENARLLELEDIIPVTNRIWDASQQIQFSVADSLPSMQGIVDALYFIFYEGAGSDNLRFITSGLADREELDAVMNVKHLRNKWFQHDLQHGGAGKMKSGYRTLRETFERLTGSPTVPNSSEEFIKLNLRLLEELNIFLNLLLSRIRMRAS